MTPPHIKVRGPYPRSRSVMMTVQQEQEQVQVQNQQVKVDPDLYGRLGHPIPVTKVYRRDMPFDFGHIKTQSWILVNEKTGTRVHLNSYDGKLGRNLAEPQAHPLPDTRNKKWRRKLAEYQEVEISECPFAVHHDEYKGDPETAVPKAESFDFQLNR